MESQAASRRPPPAASTPKELAARIVDNIETEVCGRGESRLVWDEAEATFAHLLTKHAADCAALIGEIQLRDKELGAYKQNQAGHELDCLALTARAEKAEARVKEQQAELSEQEVDKLSLLRELREARAALHNATR